VIKMKKIIKYSLEIFVVLLIITASVAAINFPFVSKKLNERLKDDYSINRFVYNYVPDNIKLAKINQNSEVNGLLQSYYQSNSRLILVVVMDESPSKGEREAVFEFLKGKGNDQTLVVISEDVEFFRSKEQPLEELEDNSFWLKVAREYETLEETIPQEVVIPEAIAKRVMMYMQAFIKHIPPLESEKKILESIEEGTEECVCTRKDGTEYTIPETTTGEPIPKKQTSEKQEEYTTINSAVSSGCCQISVTKCKTDATQEQCSSPSLKDAIFYTDNSCSANVCTLTNAPNKYYRDGYEAIVKKSAGQFRTYKLTLMLYDIKDTGSRKQWLKGAYQAYANSDRGMVYVDGVPITQILEEAVEHVDLGKSQGLEHWKGDKSNAEVSYDILASIRKSRGAQWGWKAGFIRSVVEYRRTINNPLSDSETEDEVNWHYIAVSPGVSDKFAEITYKPVKQQHSEASNQISNSDYKKGYDAGLKYVSGEGGVEVVFGEEIGDYVRHPYQGYKLTLMIYDLDGDVRQENWLKGLKQAWVDSVGNIESRLKKIDSLYKTHADAPTYVDEGKSIGYQHARSEIPDREAQAEICGSYLVKSGRSVRGYALGWKAGYIRGFYESIKVAKGEAKESEGETMYNALRRSGCSMS